MIIKEEESNTITSSSKYSSMLRVGRVILEAFQKYSLLQLPFSPASEADEATSTAAQFFAYHGLIAECTTVDELADNKKKWISFSGDHGWHVSREWLSIQEEETMGTPHHCTYSKRMLATITHTIQTEPFLAQTLLSSCP
jgi:hypothetical protein